MAKYITKNFKETQKLGQKMTAEILALNVLGPVVLGLQGDLGGGKTTFLQGFAKELGIKEKILSPTFVIMKRFKIKNLPAQAGRHFKNFYHIDCYRADDEKSIKELGFLSIISDQKNIVAVEWPEKIKKLLPKSTIIIKFDFIDENKREIDVNF